LFISEILILTAFRI